MTKYDLIPYIGPLPLTFKMNSADVEILLGKSLRTWKDNDELLEMWPEVSVRYNIKTGKVVEIGFSEQATLEYYGINLFGARHTPKILCDFDKAPLESLGFIVFFKLGIVLADFHEGGSRAITVFAKGRWDQIKSQMKPYNRYGGQVK